MSAPLALPRGRPAGHLLFLLLPRELGPALSGLSMRDTHSLLHPTQVPSGTKV